MAGADYYRCDVCGCKCFYDACLNWDDVSESKPEVRGQDDVSLDYCGDIAAICVKCSETHKCQVVEK
jgi:hypothetical protein